MGMINFMIFLLAITCFMANAKAIREMPNDQTGLNLTTRLQTSIDLLDCWNSLTEIRSCSNEIVLFLINGQSSNIAPACCRAVEMITHQCWPAMLASLGFTSEESKILDGFCGAFYGPAPSPSA